MLKLDYRYYLNAYARQEKRFFDISQHITINNAQLNVYSAELADHIVNSVSLIEGISNELYARICLDMLDMKEDQIQPLIDQGFPDDLKDKSISINDRKAFETKSLRALEVLWQLSHKQLQINAYSIHLTRDYTITPFRYAYLTQEEINILRKKYNDYTLSRPLWSEAYRSIKHNRLDSLKPYFNVNEQMKITTNAANKCDAIVKEIGDCIQKEKEFINKTKSESKSLFDDFNNIKNIVHELKNNILSLEDMVSRIDRETKPTVKAALEAMGALYILCIYARYIQDAFYTKHDAPEVCNLIDFDPSMESKLFITVPYEAVIDNPCQPLNNNSLKDFRNLSSSIFVQKDQQTLLKQVLCLDLCSRNKKLGNDIITNFLPNNSLFIVTEDGDQQDKYSMVSSLPFDFSFNEYKALSKQKAATTLMLLGYPRKIVLNTYCHTSIKTVQKQDKTTEISINSVNDDIYNYKDLNQTLIETERSLGQ